MYRSLTILALALVPAAATAQVTIPVEDAPFKEAGQLSARLDPTQIVDSDLYDLVPADAVTADLLTSARVIDFTGDRMGGVQGVIVEDQTITGIVLPVGGALGAAERPVAVPIDAVLVGRSEELGDARIVVGLTASELAELPRWEG